MQMTRVMRKGPGRHDTWFRVICIWNLRQNKSKMAEALRYVHSRSDFYGFNCYFRTLITSIMLFGEWSGQKCLKLKMDKICRPGPFRMTRPKCVLLFWLKNMLIHHSIPLNLLELVRISLHLTHQPTALVGEWITSNQSGKNNDPAMEQNKQGIKKAHRI